MSNKPFTMNDDHRIRSWCLTHSTDSNKVGTSGDKVIKDAESYYGFITRSNAEIIEVKEEKENAK